MQNPTFLIVDTNRGRQLAAEYLKIAKHFLKTFQLFKIPNFKQEQTIYTQPIAYKLNTDCSSRHKSGYNYIRNFNLPSKPERLSAADHYVILFMIEFNS